MKFFGAMIRYFLNINTIWGLMILASFVLCVAQHYLPTTTPIPADRFIRGQNTLTLKITDSGNKATTFDYPLAFSADNPDALVLPHDDLATHKDRPRLLSAIPTGNGFLLKWDTERHGQYEAAVNGHPVAKGKLVTLGALSDAAISYATKAFEIALGLVSTMVLFLGLMKVGEDAGIVQLVARVFHPVIRFLFPQVPRDHPAGSAILMNMTTSMLGLGNAATPFGLKAMKELQSLNRHKDVASDSQIMLLAYNTAGLALIPTTLLAVRKAAGCSDPFEIIGTCLLGGATATVVALITAKLLGRLPLFSVEAALAEGTDQSPPPAANSASGQTPAQAATPTPTGAPDSGQENNA